MRLPYCLTLSYTAILLGAPVYATDGCEQYLARYAPHEKLDEGRINLVASAMHRNYGVDVIPAARSSVSTRSGGQVFLDVSGNHPIPQVNRIFENVELHHESIHVAEERNLVEKPDHPDNPLMVVFQRKTAPIKSRLPSHQNEFSLSEVKAQYKSALYFRQIARQYIDPSQTMRLTGFDKAAKDKVGLGIMLGRLGVELLDELQVYLQRPDATATIIEHKFDPNLFWIQFPLPKDGEDPVIVTLAIRSAEIRAGANPSTDQLIQAIDRSKAATSNWIRKLTALDD